MLEIIERIREYDENDNTSICMIRMFKDVVFKQEQVIREQQMIFFGLSAWIVALLAFIVFTRRN